MKKVLVTVDQDLLREVQDMLGTDTVRKTVERALCEVILRRHALVAIDNVAGLELEPR